MTYQSNIELAIPQHSFDMDTAERFTARMLGVFNDAALALMTSIGHRTALFDTMAALPAATAPAIAKAAELNERYVREWLAAMTTAGVVAYEPATNAYRLPPEHAAWLTRDACPNNLAVFAQYFGILGQVEDRIVECFRRGGGLSYGCYGGFHRVMAEDSAQTIVFPLFDHILPLAPGLMERLEQGIEVLDVGCSVGRALNKMAARFPNSRFRGYDLGEDAIVQANAEAGAQNLPNVRFQVKDVTHLDEIQRYDLITTFDAVHDQKEPASVLRAIRRALAPGGTYLMQDIAGSSYLEKNLDHPVATLLYTISCMHCMSVSLGQGGEGLGTMWGEETALRMLRDAGFETIEQQRLTHDFMNVYFICH
jgi:2-polyprenyl-3-methyl-5-hydroxy-6-metoxy-1,4-benzoquinol methylase